MSINCDLCHQGVIGVRFKCSTCPDYDLCEECIVANDGPGHLFLRLPVPLAVSSLKRFFLFILGGIYCLVTEVPKVGVDHS
jgi:hypothetical protein